MALKNRIFSDFGAYGSLFINDQVENSGSFAKITVVSASIFAVLSGSMGGDAYNTTLFPAGTVIQGEFKNIKLTSGIIIANIGN